MAGSDELNKRGALAAAPRWSLIFLTDSALYIQHGSSENWFQRLFTMRRTAEDQERVRIPVASVTRVIVPPPKTGIYRLLSSPEVLVTVEHTGSPERLFIYLDRRGAQDKEIIDLLEKLGTLS
jgi:hypothetical protein